MDCSRDLTEAYAVAQTAIALQRTTRLLIQALTEQLRAPDEAISRRVRQLEAERDRLHDELTRLEEAYAAQQARMAEEGAVS